MTELANWRTSVQLSVSKTGQTLKTEKVTKGITYYLSMYLIIIVSGTSVTCVVAI